jgi:hypothetical protein
MTDLNTRFSLNLEEVGNRMKKYDGKNVSKVFFSNQQINLYDNNGNDATSVVIFLDAM